MLCQVCKEGNGTFKDGDEFICGLCARMRDPERRCPTCKKRARDGCKAYF